MSCEQGGGFAEEEVLLRLANELPSRGEGLRLMVYRTFQKKVNDSKWL